MEQIQKPKPSESSEVVRKPKKKAVKKKVKQKSKKKAAPKKKTVEKSLALSGTLDKSRTAETTSQPEHPRIGTKVGGYTLVEKVGAGGFGEVLRGERQTKKGVEVAAFKFPHDPLDAKIVRSLRQEAKAAQRLDNPNIVGPEKVVNAKSGLYLQMPYVDAECLDVTEPRAVHECLSLAQKIGKLLAYAHEKGVVHQDTKPENILIDADGKVHLLDFGLARVKKEQEVKLSQETSRPRSLSLTGPIGGTLDYLSPEQKNGDKVDHRADIYGLAVLLYKMLTKGGSPAGSVKKVLLRHDVPEQIAAAIEDGGITQLEDRYKTMEEFLSNITTPDEELGVTIEGTNGWWIQTKNNPNSDVEVAFLTYLGKNSKLELSYIVYKSNQRHFSGAKEGEKLLTIVDKNCEVKFGNVDKLEMEFDDEEEILKYKDILKELPRKFKYKGVEVDLEDSIEQMLEFAEEEAERTVRVIGPMWPVTKGITRADLDRYVQKIYDGNYQYKISTLSGIVTTAAYSLATGNVASGFYHGIGAFVLGYMATIIGALTLTFLDRRAKDLSGDKKQSNTGPADLEIEGTPEEIAEYEESIKDVEVDVEPPRPPRFKKNVWMGSYPVEPEGKPIKYGDLSAERKEKHVGPSERSFLGRIWDARPKFIYINAPPKEKLKPRKKAPYKRK